MLFKHQYLNQNIYIKIIYHKIKKINIIFFKNSNLVSRHVIYSKQNNKIHIIYENYLQMNHTFVYKFWNSSIIIITNKLEMWESENVICDMNSKLLNSKKIRNYLNWLFIYLNY